MFLGPTIDDGEDRGVGPTNTDTGGGMNTGNGSCAAKCSWTMEETFIVENRDSRAVIGHDHGKGRVARIERNGFGPAE